MIPRLLQPAIYYLQRAIAQSSVPQRESLMSPHGRFLLKKIRQHLAMPDDTDPWQIEQYLEHNKSLVKMLKYDLVPLRSQIKSSADKLPWVCASGDLEYKNDLFWTDLGSLNWE